MIRTLLLLLLVAGAVTSDFYQALGVPRSATDSEIRKAFKEKSLKLHPDRSPTPHSGQQYQRIIQAYEVLKDAHKKRVYDLTGRAEHTANTHSHNQYQQTYDQFRGFEDIFRQFEEQINSRRQYNQRQKSQHNFFDEQEFEVRQFIDEFGRVHTVLNKRNPNPNLKSQGGLLDFARASLMTPLHMVVVFGVAYLLVSICSGKEQKK